MLPTKLEDEGAEGSETCADLSKETSWLQKSGDKPVKGDWTVGETEWMPWLCDPPTLVFVEEFPEVPDLTESACAAIAWVGET